MSSITDESVLIDLAQRALLLRPPGTTAFSTYPLSSIIRIRIREAPARIILTLVGGGEIDVAPLANQELAMRIARAIALITRCSIEVDPEESQPLRAKAAIAGPRVAGLTRSRIHQELDPTHRVEVIEARLLDADDDTEVMLDGEPILDDDDEDTQVRLVTPGEAAVRSDSFSGLPDEATPRQILPLPAWPPAALDSWAAADVRITPRPGTLHRRPKSLDSSRWSRAPWVRKPAK